MTHEKAHDKNSHKESGGELISSDAWQQWLGAEGLTFEGSAQTEGGLLRRLHDNEVTGWVLPPLFRRKAAELRTNDIKKLATQDRADPEQTPNAKLQTGIELELFGYNPDDRDMAPIMSDEAQRQLELEVPNVTEQLFGDRADRWSCSPELLNSCIEINFPEHADSRVVAKNIVERFKLLDRVIEKVVPGAAILPVSTLPHRELTEDDLTSDTYVRRMALEIMGWDMVRHFTGASMQGHTEGLSRTAILSAINQYQHVSPLFYGLTLAAPFTHGELSGLSGRYQSRVDGSPSAGIFDAPLPTSLPAYYELVERQLKEGSTPSAARGAGQHRDRPRFDIPPYGTIETCEADTAGAAPRRLIAVQYAKDVLLWKLQRQHLLGGDSHYRQYPRLFGLPSRDSYGRAHEASIKVAAQGLDAVVEAQDGRTYYAHQLVQDVLNFVQEPVLAKDGTVLYGGLPHGVQKELHKACLTPLPHTLNLYRDRSSIDMRGYYETGIGTYAHWMKARYSDLRTQGMAHETAMHDSLKNAAESWLTHIRRMSPQAAQAVVTHWQKS